ncbi:ELMO domain-containing protein C [Durusdinium trenchii]|uniref:ELMO domain-containing protein C n=1 Tax=Durusdinium trenchii TaxID=1381693 RepID=A0ABP0QBL2_9DINO
MASTEPLLPSEDTSCGGKVKKACNSLLKFLAIVFVVLFALTWLLQFACYKWATLGCSPSKLTDYSYPGGGKNASFNLLPAIHLLAERSPNWYGSAFDVIPSNEASTVAAAPVGTWWQTWGPIFPIYTYEDVANSQTTVVMRRKLLRLGQSHVIQRCDGEGPVIYFTEGMNFFSNRVRKLFHMNQAMSYKIFLNDELVAVAEETQQGFQSITFRGVESRKELASSVLQERHFHGKFDLWLVQNHKKDLILPDYVASATTLLYAFFTLHQDRRKVMSHEHEEHHDNPHFLAAAKRLNASDAEFQAAGSRPEHVTVPIEMPVEMIEPMRNKSDRFV